MTKQTNWFTADKKGLADITMRAIEKRGPGILVAELFQNAMDANATQIDIGISWDAHSRRVFIECTDNGDGFADLTHAWTMFAPSIKKDDATKAGRFNVGEKFVLSIASEANIATTCGSVGFYEQGRRKSRVKREKGTNVVVALRLKKENVPLMLDFCEKLIVPDHIDLKVNGTYLKVTPERLHVFDVTLPTEIGDELRKTQRKTNVELYGTGGEVAMLYELGIPVVETGDKYHINVMQKIPLNVDRDNVTPSYLRLIRVHVLNATYDLIDENDVTTPWVQEAASDSRSKPEATQAILDVQYGRDALVENPFDGEANAKAVAAGRTLIPCRALPKGLKNNLYDRGQVQTSSQVFSKKTLVSAKRIPESDWTDRMHVIKKMVDFIAANTVEAVPYVQMIDSPDASTVADYESTGNGFLRFNMAHPAMPNEFVGMVDLIIHELGHYYESNHLSESYYNALSRIGAKLAVVLTDRRTEKFEDLKWAFADSENPFV